MSESHVLRRARLVLIDLHVSLIAQPDSEVVKQASAVALPRLGFCPSVSSRHSDCGIRVASGGTAFVCTAAAGKVEKARRDAAEKVAREEEAERRRGAEVAAARPGPGRCRWACP